MNRPQSDIERFARDPQANRLLVQEQTIVELTIEVCRLMERQGVSKSELARRMGRTKGQISQMLSGGRNLTIRSLSDLLLALGRRLEPKTRDANEPPRRYFSLSADGDWHEGPATTWGAGEEGGEPPSLQEGSASPPHPSLAG